MQARNTSEQIKNVRQCFFDFCKQTILHGWHYLAEGEKTSPLPGSAPTPQPPKCMLKCHRKNRNGNCCCCCSNSQRGPGPNPHTDTRGTSMASVASAASAASETNGTNNRGPHRCIHNRLKHAHMSLKKRRTYFQNFRSAFWSLIVLGSVMSGAFFLHNNTREFLNSTVQTTLDGSVPLSDVFFPSVVVCNINQIRKSFFAELGFYENDTLVRIMYEDFIKGIQDHVDPEDRFSYDPKRAAFYEVRDKYS
ncbi:hypothetical protein TCAL_14853 [Tigriopus californicus]|uniref:Uncharacterized protein n=1 Tax=Tigriopus californicus TaxID=6832 RepID=A0A553P3M5_TIGCA|nr:hypothetical protein TCAL_14853 [Tigriopus californicus]